MYVLLPCRSSDANLSPCRSPDPSLPDPSLISPSSSSTSISAGARTAPGIGKVMVVSSPGSESVRSTAPVEPATALMHHTLPKLEQLEGWVMDDFGEQSTGAQQVSATAEGVEGAEGAEGEDTEEEWQRKWQLELKHWEHLQELEQQQQQQLQQQQQQQQLQLQELEQQAALQRQRLSDSDLANPEQGQQQDKQAQQQQQQQLLLQLLQGQQQQQEEHHHWQQLQQQAVLQRQGMPDSDLGKPEQLQQQDTQAQRQQPGAVRSELPRRFADSVSESGHVIPEHVQQQQIQVQQQQDTQVQQQQLSEVSDIAAFSFDAPPFESPFQDPPARAMLSQDPPPPPLYPPTWRAPPSPSLPLRPLSITLPLQQQALQQQQQPIPKQQKQQQNRAETQQQEQQEQLQQPLPQQQQQQQQTRAGTQQEEQQEQQLQQAMPHQGQERAEMQQLEQQEQQQQPQPPLDPGQTPAFSFEAPLFESPSQDPPASAMMCQDPPLPPPYPPPTSPPLSPSPPPSPPLSPSPPPPSPPPPCLANGMHVARKVLSASSLKGQQGHQHQHQHQQQQQQQEQPVFGPLMSALIRAVTQSQQAAPLEPPVPFPAPPFQPSPQDTSEERQLRSPGRPGTCSPEQDEGANGTQRIPGPDPLQARYEAAHAHAQAMEAVMGGSQVLKSLRSPMEAATAAGLPALSAADSELADIAPSPSDKPHVQSASLARGGGWGGGGEEQAQPSGLPQPNAPAPPAALPTLGLPQPPLPLKPESAARQTAATVSMPLPGAMAQSPHVSTESPAAQPSPTPPQPPLPQKPRPTAEQTPAAAEPQPDDAALASPAAAAAAAAPAPAAVAPTCQQHKPNADAALPTLTLPPLPTPAPEAPASTPPTPPTPPALESPAAVLTPEIPPSRPSSPATSPSPPPSPKSSTQLPLPEAKTSAPEGQAIPQLKPPATQAPTQPTPAPDLHQTETQALPPAHPLPYPHPHPQLPQAETLVPIGKGATSAAVILRCIALTQPASASVMAAVRTTHPHSKEEQLDLQRTSAAVHACLLEQQTLRKLGPTAGEVSGRQVQGEGTSTTNHAFSRAHNAGEAAATKVQQFVSLAEAQQHTPSGTSTSNFLSRTHRVTDLTELGALHGLPPSPSQPPPAPPHHGLTAPSFVGEQQAENAPLQSQRTPPLQTPPLPLQSQRPPPLQTQPLPLQPQRTAPSLQSQQPPHRASSSNRMGGLMRAFGSVVSKLRHATSSASSPPFITQQQQQQQQQHQQQAQAAQSQQRPLSHWALRGGPHVLQGVAMSSSVWQHPRQPASTRQSQKLGAPGLTKADSISSTMSTGSTRGRVVVPRRRADKASLPVQSPGSSIYPGGIVGGAQGEDGTDSARQVRYA
ncbi:hypothetical protein DUNSADRAFT_17911 [Dunaliella salina]|uniref:Uncharacterized protein n=1 Tax=Dunaliella salina TaxID=3046 RepID=A0ABQ7H8Z8_DUNSA|nr:hypothetical protein DUNSADRAFT_17911 [Dunaliella salina]|eukprot:KAF5843333.1 hypothetical protein DUNSADRAFT_17911 [Dunaliella salina]